VWMLEVPALAPGIWVPRAFQPLALLERSQPQTPQRLKGVCWAWPMRTSKVAQGLLVRGSLDANRLESLNDHSRSDVKLGGIS
jgi:hypothetical protein